MRPIDADELLEYAWKDKLDTRESIATMIASAPTIYKGGLIWVKPTQLPLYSQQNDFFLAYQPGWAICVAYWRCGEGWRRFSDNEHMYPELVAQINLPK